MTKNKAVLRDINGNELCPFDKYKEHQKNYDRLYNMLEQFSNIEDQLIGFGENPVNLDIDVNLDIVTNDKEEIVTKNIKELLFEIKDAISNELNRQQRYAVTESKKIK